MAGYRPSTCGLVRSIVFAPGHPITVPQPRKTKMRELNSVETQQVSGGSSKGACGCDDGSTARPKGNNGWGNGAEGTNAGSFSGGTAGSKSDETWTAGDGPRPGKFTTR